MNIIEKLKQLGVEATPEIEKALAGDYLSDLEVEKKIKKIEMERDDWKKKAEDAETTLKGFEGKDFDSIQRERDDWKKRAEDAEADFKKQMEERDYADAVDKHVADINFTSESAKKAYVAELKAAGLKIKDGKIFGLQEFLDEYSKNDPDAIVSEEQQRANENKAVFTTRMGNPPKPGTKLGMSELMKMKNENPGLDITQYM